MEIALVFGLGAPLIIGFLILLIDHIDYKFWITGEQFRQRQDFYEGHANGVPTKKVAKNSSKNSNGNNGNGSR